MIWSYISIMCIQRMILLIRNNSADDRDTGIESCIRGKTIVFKKYIIDKVSVYRYRSLNRSIGPFIGLLIFIYIYYASLEHNTLTSGYIFDKI